MTKQVKNKNNRGYILQLILGIFFGLLIGRFDYSVLLKSSEATLIDWLLIPLFLLVTIFINMNIHEFGHYIFGKMFGYKLVLYRISFLSWKKENGKVKFEFIKNKGYSGLCAMIPPKHELSEYKNALFYAGGVIFNTLTGLTFLFITILFINISKLTNMFFFYMSITALFLGVINSLPLSINNMPLDGKIFWSIIFKKPFSKKLMEIVRISSQLAAGIRPRELDTFDLDNIDNPQGIDLMAIIYLYFKALDSNQNQQLIYYTETIENNIENFPNYLQNALYYELCYINCITNNADKAKMYYDKCKMRLHNDNDSNGSRVKAYYEYYINKDESSALSFCESAIKVIDKFPIKGQAIMEQDLVSSLTKLIEKRF